MRYSGRKLLSQFYTDNVGEPGGYGELDFRAVFKVFDIRLEMKQPRLIIGADSSLQEPQIPSSEFRQVIVLEVRDNLGNHLRVFDGFWQILLLY